MHILFFWTSDHGNILETYYFSNLIFLEIGKLPVSGHHGAPFLLSKMLFSLKIFDQKHLVSQSGLNTNSLHRCSTSRGIPRYQSVHNCSGSGKCNNLQLSAHFLWLLSSDIEDCPSGQNRRYCVRGFSLTLSRYIEASCQLLDWLCNGNFIAI